MLRSLLLMVFVAGLSGAITAQENCKVLLPAINKKYEGECKKGLAHGKGTAMGNDTYTGDFKNGLPHGIGKYTWENGNVYKGHWKKGQRHGRGVYTFQHNGQDSTLKGMWKKGEFDKVIEEKPYKVIRKMGITRYNIRKVKDGNKVTVTLRDAQGQRDIKNFTFGGNNGQYFTFGNYTFGYDNIMFPFTGVVKYRFSGMMRNQYHDAIFEFEITKPGDYKIELSN